jgi:hypothetical protein
MTVMMALLVSLKFKIVFLRAEAVSESDEDGKTILDPTSPKSFGSGLTYCTSFMYNWGRFIAKTSSGPKLWEKV